MSANSAAYERRRVSTRDASLPWSGKSKTARVDLGLALLAIVAKRGQPLTLHDIAAWCGCTYKGVYMLEQRAMRKVRNKLRFGKTAAIWKELAA